MTPQYNSTYTLFESAKMIWSCAKSICALRTYVFFASFLLSVSLCYVFITLCVCGVASRPSTVVMAAVVIADEDMSDASDGEGYQAAESN